MKKATILTLVLSLVLTPTVIATGLDSKKAAYHGGSTKEKDFPGLTKPVEGKLNTDDEKSLKFEYSLNNSSKIYEI